MKKKTDEKKMENNRTEDIKSVRQAKAGKNPMDDAALMQDLQQKYMEYQTLEQQSRQMQTEVQKINEHLYELEFIKVSLDEYDKVKGNNELLSPISSGIFVKSKITDTKSFYVNVGSGIVVKKNLEETKELLNTQIEDIKVAQQKIMASFQQINLKLQSLEEELMRVAG